MPLDLAMGLPPAETYGDVCVDDFVAKQREMADAAYRVLKNSCVPPQSYLCREGKEEWV